MRANFELVLEFFAASSVCSSFRFKSTFFYFSLGSLLVLFVLFALCMMYSSLYGLDCD